MSRYRNYGVTVGELGASAAQTIMVALLPLLVAGATKSAFLIGFLVGGEGIFALFVPAWVGHHSDALPHALAERFGRRTLFLMISAVLMAATLIWIPFVHGYWPLAAVAFVFFTALHTYFTPLWTLMIDRVPDERRGRVQSVRSIWRALGLGYGLIGGGILFEQWHPLPFWVAAFLILATTVITTHAANYKKDEIDEPPTVNTKFLETLKALHKNRAGFWLLVANALWNGAVDGIRPYFFLFAIAVLHIRVSQASLGLSVLVISLAAGSVLLGRLGDKYPRNLLMQIGTGLGTIAMFMGMFLHTLSMAMVLLIIAGVGMAAVVVLGYPLFATVAGTGSAAANTGVFVMSVGIGRIVAPIVMGAAIDAGTTIFPSTHGYAAMWLLAGLLMAGGSVALWYASHDKHQQAAIRGRRGVSAPSS